MTDMLFSLIVVIIFYIIYIYVKISNCTPKLYAILSVNYSSLKLGKIYLTMFDR